jgi:Flp pilus assembly pilin Flp
MKHLMELLKRAFRDERGAEGAEKLLIVAAIVLPLLGLLIYFRDWITRWIEGLADEVGGDAADNPYTQSGPDAF